MQTFPLFHWFMPWVSSVCPFILLLHAQFLNVLQLHSHFPTFPFYRCAPSFFPLSPLIVLASSCSFMFFFRSPLSQSIVDKVNLKHSAHSILLIHTLIYTLIFTRTTMHQQVLIPSSPQRFPFKGFIYKGSYWVWFSMVNTAQLYHSHINLERASC